MSSKKDDKGKDNIRVFVSYAMEDRVVAEELMNQLGRLPKFQVYTTNRISAGEKWQSEIKKELSRSDYFLVLLSPTSVQSKWVQLELGAAWGLNKSIIPVVTSQDVVKRIPLELGNLQVIQMSDLREKPDSIGQIIESYQKTAA
jgi:TIR domain